MIDLLYFTFIFFSAFSLGKKIIDKLKLNINSLEMFVFSFAIGLGLFSYVTLFFGIFGLMYKSIFLSLIFVILLFSKNEFLFLVTWFKSIINKIKKLGISINLILIIIFFVFILLNLISSLSPPYLWDEVTYNIALPKVYAKHHKIIPVYDEFRANYPFNINMLFTLGLLIGNASLSKLFMFWYGTLLAIAIFSFAKRYFSLRSALFAALIFYTMPMISNHISTTYTDIGVAFYIFLAYYAFYMWFENNKVEWFYLSAVMTGLSIASKHTALYYLPPLFIGIYYKLMFKNKEGLWRATRRASTYFFVVFLFVSPWIIKSYIYTGNPIFPFGYSIFGGKYWDYEMSTNLVALNFLDLVGERTLPNFLIKFWNLTMHSSSYGMLLGLGPIFLAFVPLIILFKKVKPAVKYLLLYSAISFTIWFFGPQVLRYLMIYPMLSIVSATIVDSTLKIKKVRVVVILLLISSLVFNLALWYGANRVKLPYVFGIESEQDFYLKLKDHNGYNVFKYANENLPKNSKLLLFKEARGYLSDLDYIRGDPLVQKVVDYSKMYSSDDMYKELKQLGITHILINTKIEFFGVHKENQPPRYSEKILNLMDETLQKHGKLIYQDRGLFLYELT